MGCGDCSKKIEALELQLRELRAVLDELRSEYLDLAADYDVLRGAVDGDDEKDEDE